MRFLLVLLNWPLMPTPTIPNQAPNLRPPPPGRPAPPGRRPSRIPRPPLRPPVVSIRSEAPRVPPAPPSNYKRVPPPPPPMGSNPTAAPKNPPPSQSPITNGTGPKLRSENETYIVGEVEEDVETWRCSTPLTVADISCPDIFFGPPFPIP